jgi:hypothetical protein
LNDLLAGLARWMLRLLLLAMGVVFFVSLLAAALVLALLWGLRALWARVTGRSVTPWAMPIDPRTGLDDRGAPQRALDGLLAAALRRVQTPPPTCARCLAPRT